MPAAPASGAGDAERPPPNDADGIRGAVAASSAALDQGDAAAAARHFIDYWMEPGSWAQTPAARKPAIEASVVNAAQRRPAERWVVAGEVCDSWLYGLLAGEWRLQDR